MANAEFSREQPRWVSLSLSVRRSSQQLCAMPIERCFRAAQRRAVGLGMRTVAVEEILVFGSFRVCSRTLAPAEIRFSH